MARDARRSAALLLLVASIAALCTGRAAGQEVSHLCLGCICEAVSNCNLTKGCEGEICGPFAITEPYWADAGRPGAGSYQACTTDPHCAGEAVRGYMKKYAKDCDGNGVVNCLDMAAVHMFGPSTCSRPLDSIPSRPLFLAKLLGCRDALAAHLPPDQLPF